jgi:hypothetical protein
MRVTPNEHATRKTAAPRVGTRAQAALAAAEDGRAALRRRLAEAERRGFDAADLRAENAELAGRVAGLSSQLAAAAGLPHTVEAQGHEIAALLRCARACTLATSWRKDGLCWRSSGSPWAAPCSWSARSQHGHVAHNSLHHRACCFLQPPTHSWVIRRVTKELCVGKTAIYWPEMVLL